MKKYSKKMLIILSINIYSICAFTQTIPKDANLMKVKGISFLQVCNLLLDSGYIIEKKDNELQTVKTEIKEYAKSFNGAFYLQIRVKDSIAFIRAYFTAPWWDPFTRAANKTDRLWTNELACYTTNNKGKFRNTLYSYPFVQMIELFKGVCNNCEYIKE